MHVSQNLETIETDEVRKEKQFICTKLVELKINKFRTKFKLHATPGLSITLNY